MAKKRNHGLDYSDVQELSVEVMRKNPSAKNGEKWRWNNTCEKLCDEADKRITAGTYNKEAHRILRFKLFEALNGR